MTDRFPPANFVPTHSAISGIEIWLPAPEDAEHHEALTFRCPQCAGQRAYSAAREGIA